MLLVGRETAVTGEGGFTFRRELAFPAVQAAAADAQLTFELSSALAAYLQQMDGFELELTRVVSSGRCHHVPPRVVSYTILAYCRVHFLGGRSFLPAVGVSHW